MGNLLRALVHHGVNVERIALVWQHRVVLIGKILTRLVLIIARYGNGFAAIG